MPFSKPLSISHSTVTLLSHFLDFIPYPFSFVLYLTVFQMLSFVKRGRRVAGVELRHLTGQPGGGGD
jgi:hypothetical protein